MRVLNQNIRAFYLSLRSYDVFTFSKGDVNNGDVNRDGARLSLSSCVRPFSFPTNLLTYELIKSVFEINFDGLDPTCTRIINVQRETNSFESTNDNNNQIIESKI